MDIQATLRLAGLNIVAQSQDFHLLDRLRAKRNLFFYRGVVTPQLLSEIFTFDDKGLNFEQLGSGRSGTVFQARVNDFKSNIAPFVVKVQPNEEQVKERLKAAEPLQRCGGVSFRTFELEFDSPDTSSRHDFLATFMDRCEADCSELVLSKDRHMLAFSDFLNTLNKCLRDHGLTFTDMKPHNVGYLYTAQTDTYTFRLLDLDGTNAKVSTYPATANWVIEFKEESKCSQDDQMLYQTVFASAITKMMVCGSQAYRNKVHARFYYKVFLPRVLPGQVFPHGPYEEQLKFLESSEGQGNKIPQVREAATDARRVLKTAREWQRRFGWKETYLELPRPH